jgi:hypothetical protein
MWDIACNIVLDITDCSTNLSQLDKGWTNRRWQVRNIDSDVDKRYYTRTSCIATVDEQNIYHFSKWLKKAEGRSVRLFCIWNSHSPWSNTSMYTVPLCWITFC